MMKGQCLARSPFTGERCTRPHGHPFGHERPVAGRTSLERWARGPYDYDAAPEPRVEQLIDLLRSISATALAARHVELSAAIDELIETYTRRHRTPPAPPAPGDRR